MHTTSWAGRGRRRALATVLVVLMTILPASVASAGGHAKKAPPKKPPKTETLFLWLDGNGDYSSEAVGDIGPGCNQEHSTEKDHIEWDTQYDGVKVNVNGQNTEVTKSADVSVTSESSWETTQSGTGEDCAADVTCTSDHIDTGSSGDPQPQAYAVGMGKTTLQLRLESVGYDFVANDTQGNQACPTQVTGEGQLLFLALVNAHMTSRIPLYFTAHVDIPIATLQKLAVGADLPEQVKIVDIPATNCETSVWSYCKDSLTWHGVVFVRRTA